jgi:hypothetical protein
MLGAENRIVRPRLVSDRLLVIAVLLLGFPDP